MNQKLNVAIVGATGVVGETFISLLNERKFPLENLYPLASENSIGKTVLCQGKHYRVQNVEEFDFSQCQVALFSAGAEVSKIFAPIAQRAGCCVIDNTSFFRMQPNIPLIVPEVNFDALDKYPKTAIIANPNCSTIQMVLTLKPIYDAVGIERVNVSTYQAVSGAGKEAIEELTQQITELLNGREARTKVMTKQIAFNVIPHIDVFEENGYSKEEMKMVLETQKILSDDNIKINTTAVRVPVINSHSEVVNIETKEKISAKTVRELFAKAPGVTIVDERVDGGYITPFEAIGKNDVFVSRIREDISHPRGINLWVVADNVRKGAALNAVQIAERLLT